MKAAILVEQNKPLEIDEVEIPDLAPGQILVKMKNSGICGKQLEEINGKRGKDPYLPHLLGHEGSGIVEDVGPSVKKVKKGDHVVLHWMKGPGIDSSTPQFSRKGRVVNAGWITTFSEFTIVSENRVTPIPKDVNFDVACLFGCAVTTGLGIVFNNAALKPGQSIAVFGVGGIGLNVIQGAALVSAYPIIAIDVYDNKLKKAVEFGATHTINANEMNPEKFLKEMTYGEGVDVAVDVTGNTDNIQKAYDSTNKTGKTILAGVVHHEKRITIDSYPLHFGKQIFGSHGGDTRPHIDIPRYIKLYKIGRLKLDELIAQRFSLEQINDAFEALKKGEILGRAIIEFDLRDSDREADDD